MGINQYRRTTSSRSTTSAKSSSFSLSQNSSHRIESRAQHTILIVIILAMLAVIFAVFVAYLITPERVITRNIESIVADYYENYFYDTVGSRNDTPVDRATILANYESTGLAPLTLKQLLYFDDGRHEDQKSTFQTYCDLTTTTVRIYPDPPFGRTDYHVLYDYSCDF